MPPNGRLRSFYCWAIQSNKGGHQEGGAEGAQLARLPRPLREGLPAISPTRSSLAPPPAEPRPMATAPPRSTFFHPAGASLYLGYAPSTEPRPFNGATPTVTPRPFGRAFSFTMKRMLRLSRLSPSEGAHSASVPPSPVGREGLSLWLSHPAILTPLFTSPSLWSRPLSARSAPGCAFSVLAADREGRRPRRACAGRGRGGCAGLRRRSGVVWVSWGLPAPRRPPSDLAWPGLGGKGTHQRYVPVGVSPSGAQGLRPSSFSQGCPGCPARSPRVTRRCSPWPPDC